MADIGVSMGNSGTDIAKEVTNVILADDDFGTILSTAEEGPTSQSLGLDPVDCAVMKRRPSCKDEPITTQRLIRRVLFSASIIFFGTLFIFARELSDVSMLRRDQTMTFTSFVVLELASALQNHGAKCGFFDNGMLLTTDSISFFVQLMLIYVPGMQSVFQTEAPVLHDLFTLLYLGKVSTALHEFRITSERKKNTEEDAMHLGGVGEMA
ncbi:High affinity Ca2+/Mn2+ P-type ATPase-like protein [Ceratobasidium sp. 428]|nr:High affinity Ca2+/Mn2+ P-type ATPase-like protein [Ceratobasidium sp. 428]